MKNVFADVVVDLQYGDCGKGKVVHHLASSGDYSLVMRFNGGSNAGHTIYHRGKKFVTHLVPAGVFHGIKSVVGGGCVINAEKFLREIDQLEEAGIEASKLVKVCYNAHVTTDRHMEEESSELKIGTTRTGNGPTYRDKHARSGVRAEEIASLNRFLIDPYLALKYEGGTGVALMEGAQGFGLDIDWGDYPYVSSSNCTVAAAVNAGVPPQNIRRVIGVAKPYVTYVGARDFAGNHPALQQLQLVGEEYGATTGRPRQCNWLSVPQLIKAANINGVNTLIFNKTDVMQNVGAYMLFPDWKTENVKEFDNMSDFQEYVEFYLRNACPLLEEIIWSSSPHEI